MKARLIFCFLLAPLLITSLSSCNHNSYLVTLGNFSDELVLKISEGLNRKCISYFARPKMQSGEVFKIVDSNASYYLDGKQYPFFSIAEKADFFIINVGMQDFLPSMTIDVNNNILDYDYDLIEKQLEIFQYHIYHTIEVINDINSKAEIVLLSAYNDYLFEKPEQILFNSIVKQVNNELMEMTELKNVKYLSLVGFNEEIYQSDALDVNDYIVKCLEGYKI
ncbi:MAG: hypothetical protein J1F31_01125 [Erysipelotrichales bacterium]|nr:hypothetical protein [Erysipelotrichales bacterium]